MSVPLLLLKRGRCGQNDRNLERYCEKKNLDANFLYETVNIPGGQRTTHAMQVSADGKYLAVARADRTIQIVDTCTNRHVQTLTPPPKRGVWGLAFCPFARVLAAGSLCGFVRLFDPESSANVQLTRSTASEKKSVTSLVFHPTKPILVVASENHLAYYNWKTEKLIDECLAASHEIIRCVKFDMTGAHLVTAITCIDEEGTSSSYHLRHALYAARLGAYRSSSGVEQTGQPTRLSSQNLSCFMRSREVLIERRNEMETRHNNLRQTIARIKSQWNAWHNHIGNNFRSQQIGGSPSGGTDDSFSDYGASDDLLQIRQMLCYNDQLMEELQRIEETINYIIVNINSLLRELAQFFYGISQYNVAEHRAKSTSGNDHNESVVAKHSIEYVEHFMHIINQFQKIIDERFRNPYTLMTPVELREVGSREEHLARMKSAFLVEIRKLMHLVALIISEPSASDNSITGFLLSGFRYDYTTLEQLDFQVTQLVNDTDLRMLNTNLHSFYSTFENRLGRWREALIERLREVRRSTLQMPDSSVPSLRYRIDFSIIRDQDFIQRGAIRRNADSVDEDAPPSRRHRITLLSNYSDENGQSEIYSITRTDGTRLPSSSTEEHRAVSLIMRPDDQSTQVAVDNNTANAHMLVTIQQRSHSMNAEARIGHHLRQIDEVGADIDHVIEYIMNRTVNHAVASAFIADDSSMSSNNENFEATSRVQRWPFDQHKCPPINLLKYRDKHILARNCKVYNESSMSTAGDLLACFALVKQRFGDESAREEPTNEAANSVTRDLRHSYRRLFASFNTNRARHEPIILLINMRNAQLLHQIKFNSGPISCQFSPDGGHLLVGFAARGHLWDQSLLPAQSPSAIANVYAIDNKNDQLTTKLERVINLGNDTDLVIDRNCPEYSNNVRYRSYYQDLWYTMSVTATTWIKSAAGLGIALATNKGYLLIGRPKFDSNWKK